LENLGAREELARRHPIQMLPYSVAAGGLAMLIGLLVGLLLRTTAVIVLKVSQPTTGYRRLAADDGL
jgi:hypothetical protein